MVFQSYSLTWSSSWVDVSCFLVSRDSAPIHDRGLQTACLDDMFWLPFWVVVITASPIQVFPSCSLSSQSHETPCLLTPFLGFQKDSTGDQALGGESIPLTPSVSTLLFLHLVHSVESKINLKRRTGCIEGRDFKNVISERLVVFMLVVSSWTKGWKNKINLVDFTFETYTCWWKRKNRLECGEWSSGITKHSKEESIP